MAESGTLQRTSYRRIFVPADRIDVWPREGDKFLPIEARDFESLIATAIRANARYKPSATIDAAEYSAILQADGRLVGHGHWKVSRRDQKTGFLPVDISAFEIRSPVWKESPQDPVRLGRWGNADRTLEQYGLQVLQDGTLEFEWSTTGVADQNQIDIPWRAPAAIAQRLTLDLPEQQEPQITNGVVLTSTALAEGRRRWVLSTNSAPDAMLRISNRVKDPAQRPATDANQPALDESTTHRIEQRGVECTFRWNLKNISVSRRELVVPLPPGVQITSVAANGGELKWQIVHVKALSADQVIVSLPDVGADTELTISVAAWHPLVLDQPWRLPTLRPEGVFWSSGKCELEVAPGFELQKLETRDCTQDDVSDIRRNSLTPEHFSFTSFGPSSTIEITIGHRRPAAALRLGSSLVLSDQEVTGRLITEWNVTGGNLHRLMGEVASGWNIETIETIPATALAEWHVERQGNRRQLTIQLTDAAGPAQKVTVVVSARLQRFSLSEPLSARHLGMINWFEARTMQHLLWFQSSAPYATEPVGELPLFNADAITDVDLTLLDPSADKDAIFELSKAAPDAGLQLVFQRGTFSAISNVAAAFTGSELRLNYRMKVEPESSAIDRLLIYSTTNLPDNSRWTDASTQEPLLAERLPRDNSQYKDLPTEGDLWLVRLPRPLSDPIEILVSAAVPLSKRSDVPLVAFPGADEQRGHVTVRSTAQAVPAIEPLGLSPSPRPSDDHTSYSPDDATWTRAEYRYHPAECLRPLRVPRLTIGAAAKSTSNNLIVRKLDLETFYWPNGRAAHRATYELENYGENEFQPTLPADARLISVDVNDQSIGAAQVSRDDGRMSIQLPSATGSTTVILCFENNQSPLSPGLVIAPPIVRIGVPVLGGQWTIWMPEEYLAQSSGPIATSTFNWRQRLFGPLARTGDSPPFRPFQLADWTRLGNDLIGIAQPALRGSDATTTNNSAAAIADSVSQPRAIVSPGQNLQPNHPPTMMATEAINSRDVLPGWRAWRESFIADGSPTEIVVLHPSATSAWAVAALFASFFIGRQWLWCRRTLHVSVVVMFTVLALVLPIAYAPLAAGVLWGIVFAWLVDWPRTSMSANQAKSGGRVRQVTVALVCLAVFSTAQLGWADRIDGSPPNTGDASARRVERVLIPVDDGLRPVGNKYFVSESFLRELLNSSAARPKTEFEWLITNAKYVGELQNNGNKGDVVAGAFTLTFTIETFARETTIVLPLAHEDGDWQPTAMLDGVPLPLRWRAEGEGCEINVEQPGRYTLTMYCTPRTESVGTRGHLRLSVPNLASAHVKIHTPDAISGIVVQGAKTEATSQAVPGVLNATLGSTSTLAVQWPRLEAKNGTGPGINVTALSWLHTGAETSELTTKLIIEGKIRQPESLTVTYADSWKLIENENVIEKGTPTAGPARRGVITVPLPATSRDRQEIVLRWQLMGFRSIGRFRLPPIQIESLPVSQHWLAISSDSTVECTVEDKSATSATVNEFLTKWGGDADRTPLVVFANYDATREPILTLRPRVTETTIRDAVQAAIRSDSMRLSYRADVSPGTSTQFQFLCSAPPELTIDDISVTADDVNVPVRWFQDATGQIVVFLGQRLRSDYRVTLTGEIPIVVGQPTHLPRVTTPTTASSALRLHLYRDDDVSVSLLGFPPAEESRGGADELPPIPWLVRPLGQYSFDTDALSKASITVVRSEPALVGDSLITLSRDAGAWTASFHSRITVERGELDSVRLQVPAGWSGPFAIDSDVPVTTHLTSLDERRRTLLIRLTNSIQQGNEFTISIHGPLAIAAGSVPAVPDVAFASSVTGRRFVVVPVKLDTQPTVWFEAGVRAADVPTKLLPKPFGQANLRQLEIIENPFRVALNPRAAMQASPRIHLADTLISMGDRGGRLIITRFCLSSDGVYDCTLALPEHDSLVSVKLDGQPALCSALGAGRWRVMLGAENLPQLIEVVSRTESDGAASSLREFRRPALLVGNRSVPVEVSLWTVSSAVNFGQRKAVDAALVAPLEQAVLRLERVASVVEGAVTAAAQAVAPDGDNWLRAWATIVREIQAESLQLKLRSNARSITSQVSSTSEEQFERAIQRLEAPLRQAAIKLKTPAFNAPAVAASAWTSTLSEKSSISYYVAEGGTDRLTLEAPLASPSSVPARLLPVLVVAGLAAIAMGVSRSPVLGECLYRWPHLMGVLFGLAWWAWLWPSWLGLVISAASVWLSLRFNWPGRSFRAEASTVLRSTRSLR